MVRTNIDSDYNDDKEIKKHHNFISLKVMCIALRKNKN
jgi:hypothetical protein